MNPLALLSAALMLTTLGSLLGAFLLAVKLADLRDANQLLEKALASTKTSFLLLDINDSRAKHLVEPAREEVMNQ